MPVPCSIVSAWLIHCIPSLQAMFGPSSSHGGANGTSSDSASGDPVTALRREVGLPPSLEAGPPPSLDLLPLRWVPPPSLDLLPLRRVPLLPSRPNAMHRRHQPLRSRHHWTHDGGSHICKLQARPAPAHHAIYAPPPFPLPGKQVCALQLVEAQLQASLAAARTRTDAATLLAGSLAEGVRGAESRVQALEGSRWVQSRGCRSWRAAGGAVTWCLGGEAEAWRTG